jgi:hypothetical protein
VTATRGASAKNDKRFVDLVLFWFIFFVWTVSSAARAVDGQPAPLPRQKGERGHEKGQRTKKRNIQFQKEFAVNRINNGKNSLLNRDVRECEEAMTELHRTRRPRE